MSQLTLKRLAVKRLRHKIDYPGALLIVAAVCCVLLVTTLGGNEVPWRSPLIKILSGIGLVLFLLCVLREWMASDPILPPRLFANAVYLAANTINLLTATVILGAIVFIPLYLQLVYGFQAGTSGLLLIPLTMAMICGAIGTGRLMARSGRYKIFPLIGAGTTATGLFLLSVITPATALPAAVGAIALCGVGIGLVNPVMMVAVQNAVEPRDVGTATSSISFFRSMGGSFGVALF